MPASSQSGVAIMENEGRKGGLPVNALLFSEVDATNPAKGWRFALMVNATWARLVQQPLNGPAAE